MSNNTTRERMASKFFCIARLPKQKESLWYCLPALSSLVFQCARHKQELARIMCIYMHLFVFSHFAFMDLKAMKAEQSCMLIGSA